MAWNWWRMKRDKREARLSQALMHLEFSMFLADLQESLGRFYVFEHPLQAITWEHERVQEIMRRETCLVAEFHMCAFGNKSLSGDGHFRKPTRIFTHSLDIHRQLHGKKCPGNHRHVAIEGSELGQKRSVHAQIYPPLLCEALAAGAESIRRQD